MYAIIKAGQLNANIKIMQFFILVVSHISSHGLTVSIQHTVTLVDGLDDVVSRKQKFKYFILKLLLLPCGLNISMAILATFTHPIVYAVYFLCIEAVGIYYCKKLQNSIFKQRLVVNSKTFLRMKRTGRLKTIALLISITVYLIRTVIFLICVAFRSTDRVAVRFGFFLISVPSFTNGVNYLMVTCTKKDSFRCTKILFRRVFRQIYAIVTYCKRRDHAVNALPTIKVEMVD